MKDNKILLNTYLYGSRVYGTNTKNSDYDFIVVHEGKEGVIKESKTELVNITIYDELSFQQEIDNHEISVLECLFLPENKIILEDAKFNFEINLEKLRESISRKSSNSWVKAKKKMTVEKDLDIYIGKKSLFHSLRILKFGIQLAQYGKIVDYTEANIYWEEIKNDPSEDWEYFKNKYQNIYNLLKSKFKILAPKG